MHMQKMGFVECLKSDFISFNCCFVLASLFKFFCSFYLYLKIFWCFLFFLFVLLVSFVFTLDTIW